MLKIVHDATAVAVDDPETMTVDLDELFRMAAQEMLAVTLLAERRAYLDAHADVTNAAGRRMVVGNGYARQRAVMTGAGMVDVKAPRVDDRRLDERFSSALLPAYMRRSPKVTEVLPLLYLRGLSTGDFGPALEGFFGSKAGLSASTICRLTEAWQAELEDWKTRDLSDVDYVYWWADGVHFNIRLEEDRLCCLVIVGVRPDGTKELVAVDDGYRESTDSWAVLLRSLRDRGVAAPVLAVGDGALGFWGALRDVFPSTREQRCWVHKTANCLDAMPKRAQPEAKAAIAAIYGGADPRRCPRGRAELRRALRRVAQGDGQDHRRARHPARLLRLPGRALAAPSNHQPDRVDLRHGAVADQDHQGCRLTGGGHGHGVQAARRRPGPVAQDQRPRAGAPRPCRRHLHRRQASGAEGGSDRDDEDRQDRVRRRLTKKPHPQLLTISVATIWATWSLPTAASCLHDHSAVEANAGYRDIAHAGGDGIAADAPRRPTGPTGSGYRRRTSTRSAHH